MKFFRCFQEDHVEAYDELPKKTKNFFATSVQRWVADFYVKVDDDVFVDIGSSVSPFGSFIYF